MLRSNKLKLDLGTGRAWLLALLVAGLALCATACKDAVGDIGVGLPNAQANTGAYLIDTLTIRASTVLRDSVVTSNSNYLLVGRAFDPQLGTIKAISAFRVGPNATFLPDDTMIFDSLVLVLTPNTYRYGDTTQVQDLVQVHRLNVALPATGALYATDALTHLNYSAQLYNGDRKDPFSTSPKPAPRGRARPNTAPFRLRLSYLLGLQLMNAGKAGIANTQDQIEAFLPGLVLTGADTDKAAIMSFSLTAGTSGLYIYYHDPLDAGTAITKAFDLTAGYRHCFQVTADRTGAAVPNLPATRLTPVPASATGGQTVIEGALGLQTKLEFPYLKDLLSYGSNITLTSAQLTLSVPTNTLTPFVPAPPALTASTINGINQPTGTYLNSVSYLTAESPTTGLDQGTYDFSILTYVQAALAQTVPNNGLLLSSVSPDLPSRVLLGGPQSGLNKPKLRIYFIQLK